MNNLKVMNGHTLYVPTSQGEIMVVCVPYSATDFDIHLLEKELHKFLDEFLNEKR